MNHILHTESNLYDDGILRVSATSRPQSVAGAIAGIIREQGYVELHAIGAAAVNQALKSVAVARQLLNATDDPDIVVIPSFSNMHVKDIGQRTVMCLDVYKRTAEQYCHRENF